MGEALQLGDNCAKIGSGATPRGGKETYSSDGPFALIRSQNVYNDRFSRGGLAYICEDQAAQLRNVEVKENDVLLNITGDSVARVCQVAKDVLPARVNQHVAIIRPHPDKIDPRFLRYFLVNPEMQHYMLAIAGAGATRNALTKGMIEDFLIPAKHLSEQLAIASLLGALDDKIELNRQTNETLEALARAIFKDWFVDFGPTRAKAEGRPPYLAPELWDLFPGAIDDEDKPEWWEVDSLGSFTAIKNGYAFKSKDWRDEGVPVVKIGSVKPGFVDLKQVSYVDECLAEERSDFRLNVGDMLVGLTGYVGETGRIPPTETPPMLNQRVGKFEPLAGLSPYVFACVRHPSFKEFAELKSHGSAQANVSTRDLLTFPVVNPGRPLAKAFCEITSSLFEKSLANEGESNSLAQTRDLLLPKLMSGEIRLREAEKLVEAVA